jgi:hypothetical protein
MDAGLEVLGGLVVFIVIGGFIVSIAPAVVLDIIWYKRVKSGKSPKFGALGIISIIATVWAILGLPFQFTLLLGLADFIR